MVVMVLQILAVVVVQQELVIVLKKLLGLVDLEL
jgi:hypothetical protein